jgi:hypothetical protein
MLREKLILIEISFKLLDSIKYNYLVLSFFGKEWLHESICCPVNPVGLQDIAHGKALGVVVLEQGNELERKLHELRVSVL